MNRASTSLFIPLAAALAVAFPLVYRFQPPATPQQQETTTPGHNAIPRRETDKSTNGEKTKPEKHDANAILSHFFGVKDYRQASWPQSDFRSRYCIDFMIATVPDPIDSRLPYLFDRFLASIQRAAEADHLVLDRYDLAWLEELQEIEAAKGSLGMEKKLLPEADDPHPYEKEPGLTLFRDPYSGASPRLLVLFLVGEIPTAGISKEAFSSALSQISEFSGPRCPSRAAEENPPRTGSVSVRILGPSFSGSVESLDYAIASWLAEHALHAGNANPKRFRFQIVSGSATAIPIKADSAVKGRSFFDFGEYSATATFEATVIRDDDVALPKFIDYLSKQQPVTFGRPMTVGLLTEANTAYGNSLASAKKGQFRSESEEQVRFVCDSSQDSSDVQVRKIKACVVGLPFPLHISRLRSESEKVRQARAQSSQELNPSTDSFKYLPVPYQDESENAQDAVPPFSDLDTSSSELILANLLSTISHEQFDYVGIAATDVRDTIFLAREIREHSPSSVIFSFNADLIYAHPEPNPNTRGMLIVTPYPLFTLNQRWMDPSQGLPDRLQFPDQNSQGVYNATLLLLGRSQDMLEYGVPFDYGSRHQMPPLWITTVGRQGFWPVAVLGTGEDGSYTHKNPGSSGSRYTDDIGRGMIPHASFFVYFCWSLLCSVPSWIFLRRAVLEGAPASSFFARDFGFPTLEWFRDPAFTRNRGECRAYFLVGAVAALAAYIVAVTAFVLASVQLPGITHPHLFLVSMLVVIALTCSACWLLGKTTFRLARHARTGDTTRSLGIPVLAISVIGLGLATWLSLRWLQLRFSSHEAAANGIVTGFRAVNLMSGVSPLPPLFLVAVAASVWAYSAVRRIRLAEAVPWTYESECDGQKDTPVETNKYSLFNSSSPSFLGFQALESRVQELLRCPSLRLPGDLRAFALLTAFSIVFAGFYLFLGRLVVALEPPVYYLLFGVCFLLVYLAIAFNTLRLLFLWLALNRVLKALERHSIRAAFARFRRSFPNLPRINLASAPSPLTALNFSIQQATALARAGKALLRSHPGLANGVVSVETHLDQAVTNYHDALSEEASKKSCSSLVSQLKAQRSLAEASCFIEGALELSWKTSPASGETDPSLEASRQKLADQAEEFLVGRVLLFLSHIFPQMTNLASLSLASLLLMLLAVSSYPFQPHQLIVLFNWALIFAFVGVTLYMSVQMNRDTLLSNLNGTKPGELNWDRDFITRILLYVVIPILGFLGVQFPNTVGQIFSFLSPGAAGHG